LIGTIKTKFVSENCKENIDLAKELNCDTFNENPKCTEIKEKTFRCIATYACPEIYDFSTKCFLENSRRDETSLFKTLFTGSDHRSIESRERYCTEVQYDLLECFEKYFYNSMVFKNDENRPVILVNRDGVPFPQEREENKEKYYYEKVPDSEK
jgi:hypothetical protein